MPRRQYTFSNKFVEMLERDAKRRIKEDNGLIGKRVGTVVRSIIVACVALSYNEIKELSWKEIENLVRRYK